MSVLDEISAEVSDVGGRCRVGPALEKLDPAVAAGYVSALRMSPADAPGSAIERALRKRGVTVRANSIQRHRRDGCTCADHLA